MKIDLQKCPIYKWKKTYWLHEGQVCLYIWKETNKWGLYIRKQTNKRIWEMCQKTCWLCEGQAFSTKETHISEKRPQKETYTSEKRPTKYGKRHADSMRARHSLQKRPKRVFSKYIIQKRPTNMQTDQQKRPKQTQRNQPNMKKDTMKKRTNNMWKETYMRTRHSRQYI